MTTAAILNQMQSLKLKEQPMVMIPIKLWEEIESQLEDFAMLRAKRFKTDIAKARQQVKTGEMVSLRNL
ncbi:MAG: hypothetical protein WCW27_06820 [Patescibacteria group bacterium]|jgi:hypothetical protein